MDYPPVTGMLLTRYAPLRRSPAMYCYIPLPLDLHVLSLPLAFILSQDQTLHCIYYKLLAPVTLYSIFPKELRSLCISTKIIVLLNYAACLSIIFNELFLFYLPFRNRLWPSFPFGTAKVVTFSLSPNFFFIFLEKISQPLLPSIRSPVCGAQR